MANNRLYLCEINDDGQIVSSLAIAKHLGGEWYVADDDGNAYVDRLNEFFRNVFINGNGITLKDEFMSKTPYPPIYVYNDEME